MSKEAILSVLRGPSEHHVWWVYNLRGFHEHGYLKGYLWKGVDGRGARAGSPFRTAVRVGDVLLHYFNDKSTRPYTYYLGGVSLVTSPVEPAGMPAGYEPGKETGDPGFIVRFGYCELNPRIDVSEIRREAREHEWQMLGKESPFREDGTLSEQGWFLPLTPEFGRTLLEQFPKPFDGI